MLISSFSLFPFVLSLYLCICLYCPSIVTLFLYRTEYFIKTQSAQFEHLLSIMASNKSAEEGELVENVSKVDIDKMIKFLHTHSYIL